MFDLIIVGASAGGISAAAYAARRRLNFKITPPDVGGEVATCGEVENWPSVIHTTGLELADQFKAQARANGVLIEEGKKVLEIRKEGNIFIVAGVNLDGSRFEDKAKTVLVATGLHPRVLNVPGEKEFLHKGLSYCTVCDGPLFGGGTVATIGGGNSALESAIALSAIAKKVYLINKNPKFKGEKVLLDKVERAPNVEIIYEAWTTAILGDQFVTGLEYRDQSGETRRLAVTGVFVHIGQIPNSDLATGAELDEAKQIKTDKFGATSIPGLYAAGDVTNIPYKQIVVAAGQGVTALLAIVDYLNRNH